MFFVATPAVVAPAGVPDADTVSRSVPAPPSRLSPVVKVSVAGAVTAVSTAVKVSAPVPPVNAEPVSRLVVSVKVG